MFDHLLLQDLELIFKQSCVNQGSKELNMCMGITSLPKMFVSGVDIAD